MVSLFQRITTTPECVSSHPFGFLINQKGWGTNVGPNSSPYAKRAEASLGRATLRGPVRARRDQFGRSKIAERLRRLRTQFTTKGNRGT
ncbi:hypothetical protein F2Q70_00036473 [Brassica cretica]|uniref:Uncharacterized protein n=1 Tax=Brassica cretica TaxID=69181 RepID=A0A3N6QBL2_BRACR|nr:hypothetical protein F2Q70_00036473 [Brassica cretica]KAF3530118.1 hypothetical protein DY000_02041502 [Brassica cretica]